MKLLVVDDEPLILSFFDAFLHERGDDFELAQDGETALVKLGERDFDVLVTDLSMPGMTGIELVARASKLRPNLVSILLTGRATKQDMVEAIKANVFDYVEKPLLDLQVLSFALDRAWEKARLIRERNELMSLLQEQNAKLEANLADLERAHDKLVRQDRLLGADLARAQRLQRSLLPRAFPVLRGVDFFGFYQPCEQLGGDFFDAVPLDDRRLALLVADVAGHGVRSAMVTVILHQLIQTQRLLHPAGAILGEPALALRFLNQALITEPFDEPIHVTMGYAVVDASSGQVVYASAGHPRPIVVRHGAGRPETLPAGGPGLGLETEPTFEQARCTLGRGDFLLPYTDGLTDIRGESGKELRTEGIMQWCVDAKGDSAIDIGVDLEERLRAYRSDGTTDDDISYVVTMRSSPGAGRRSPGAESVHVRSAPRDKAGHASEAVPVLSGWAGSDCVVRLADRATWQQGPALLAVLGRMQGAPVWLDLRACESMDSTILGLMHQFREQLTLCCPVARVVDQLAELGVIENVRIHDGPVPEASTMTPAELEATDEEQMRIVLSAHEALIEGSDANRERFGTTVELMRADLGLPPRE